MKKYRKIVTIEAEQFDGSFEMMEKYPITYAPFLTSIAPPRYSLRTSEGYFEIKVGDWIATGEKGEHWAIKDDIFKQTYELVEEEE